MSFESATRPRPDGDEHVSDGSGRGGQGWLAELEPGTCSKLVEVLFEATRAPMVITASGALVASNRAAKRLLSEMGEADVIEFLARAPSSKKAAAVQYVGSPLGALRITQLAVGGEERVNVFVIETLGVDLDKLYSLAVATWKPTARQSEVLWGILHGLSNKEIAQRLGTSHRTIEVHVSALLTRAGVDGRSRLLTAAHDLAGGAQLPTLRTARTER